MKTKNKQKDNFNELVDSISQLAEGTEQLALQAVDLYAPVVENIISTKSTDTKLIEHTLEFMLDFCIHDKMLLLFKKLCRYYYLIDPQATAEYINLYRELWDDETKQNTIND